MSKKPAAKVESTSEKSTVKGPTKAEIFSEIATKTGLAKKDVAAVFESLSETITKSLSKKGPGIFVVPGLLKIRVVNKPATKAKQGINPFTKEPMTIKAKPARRSVKVVPLKHLKDAVAK